MMFGEDRRDEDDLLLFERDLRIASEDCTRVRTGLEGALPEEELELLSVSLTEEGVLNPHESDKTNEKLNGHIKSS